MTGLHWSWLAAPYLVCAAVVVAVALAGALVRGDRVLRIGIVGAAICGLPWATCQALAACTDDAAVAGRLLRIGQGPVALVGPNLLLLLLGLSGQLERNKWIARVAGVIGAFFMFAAWMTDWIAPGAQRLASGMFYVAPGPLTGPHISQLAVWLVIGLVIARRASPRGERRRNLRLIIGVFVCAAIGSLDTFLLYGIWGVYPIAWLPATMAASIALYAVLRTDMVRPEGLDRGVLVEVVAFVIAIVAAAVVTFVLRDVAVVVQAGLAALAWVAVTAVAWGIARRRPARVASERALDPFVARVATLDDEKLIATRLAELWKTVIGIEVAETWWMDDGVLVAIRKAGTTNSPRWPLATEVVRWLVELAEPLAIGDLATMRLGELRPKLEALGSAHDADLVVPLVDRDELVGLVEAKFDTALREDERGLVAESARAAARALTYAGLARAAARERATAREVEIATALRQQASASSDAELGRWVVAAEYRAAAPTTGAGWSAIELGDGRLALLAIEAQAHGVAAALATAALTGAFAAATLGDVELEDLLVSLRASTEGVMRGGEPVAAFVAVLDARAQTIAWACAGHPGALVVGPVAAFDANLAAGSISTARPTAHQLGWGAKAPSSSKRGATTRGVSPIAPDAILVVASTALRGDDDERWQKQVRDQTPAGGRLATLLVEGALRAGAPSEDLLAVVVRSK